MIIPDFILINSLNTGLEAVRNDYNNLFLQNKESRSFLSLLFRDSGLENYVAFTQCKALIITTPKNPKHVIVKSSLDKNSNSAPFVYVTLGSENDRNNSIGIGQGDNEILRFDNTNDNETDTYKNQYSRRYMTTYYVMIGGENKNEVVILYYLFKAILTVAMNHVIFEGLQNIKIGGQDIRANTVIPDSIHIRPITLTFEYEQVVPDISNTDIIRQINLYWKPDGSITAMGPIVIENDDDLDSDSI